MNYPDKVESPDGSDKIKTEIKLPEVSNKKSGDNLGKLVEKEKYYKTYKTKNGTYKTVFSAVPNFYENFWGTEKEYDNDLVLEDKLIGQDYYKAESSNLDVEFPTQIKEGKGITFKYNGVKVDLIPVDGDYSKSATKDNAILYNSVYDGIDVQYTLHELGVKEDIILNKYVETDSFCYEIDTHGDKAILENGLVNIYKDNKKIPSYTISAPVMTDANGEISIEVKLSLIEKDGKKILSVTPSKEWIKSPERAFPIKINPNINLSNQQLLHTLTNIQQQKE